MHLPAHPCSAQHLVGLTLLVVHEQAAVMMNHPCGSMPPATLTSQVLGDSRLKFPCMRHAGPTYMSDNSQIASVFDCEEPCSVSAVRPEKL